MSSFSKILTGASSTRVALLAPLVFIFHVVEEAPTFVSWFNNLVEPDITTRSFLQVNVSVLVITIVLSLLFALSKEKAAAMLFLGWLGLFMFANAIFHIIATLVHARYSPGTVTAATLYLPYFFWFLIRLRKDFAMNFAATVAVIFVGSLPMFAHGYLIVFEGGRLF
ncbi:MAG: HXXEE domain-containing protein [bacterium]